MAALQIAERRVGDVTVLDCWGQITIGDASETLRATIKHLVENGRTRVLLHLGGVYQVDSSGLGSLVAVYTGLQKCGGDVLRFMDVGSPNTKLAVHDRRIVEEDMFLRFSGAALPDEIEWLSG